MIILVCSAIKINQYRLSIADNLPKHGLVCESVVLPCHVLSRQTTAYVGMIVMLHSPPSEVGVKETGRISSL